MRVGKPTHSSKSFDERGIPFAVTIESDPDYGDPLPENWDDLYWDWQPRFDPKGSWVQKLDKKRDITWANIKETREALQSSTLDFTINSKTFNLQIDQKSIDRLKLRLISLEQNGGTTDWTTTDNSIVTLDANDIVTIFTQISEFQNSVHSWSQQLKTKLFATNCVAEIEREFKNASFR